MDITWNWLASSGFSSTLILPTLMSGFSRAISSTMGTTMRQGPHQGAQKSSRTGLSDSMTSLLLLIPLIYLLPQFMENKTNAVYMAEPVADILAVAFTAILFFVQFRKAMAELDSNKDAEQTLLTNK
jgi:Na+-driven multidrug efflux pump